MYSRRGWYEVRREHTRVRCMARWNGKRFSVFHMFRTDGRQLSEKAFFASLSVAGDVTAFRGLKFPAKIAVTSTPVFGSAENDAKWPTPVGPTIAELVASKHLADRVPE